MSVADAALSSGWRIVGFYSPKGPGPALTLGPLISTLEEEDVLECALALGIGTNHLRELASHEITSRFPNAALATVIHKTAWVSPQAKVHPGAAILAHASVGPESTVGSGALLNTGSSLDHEGLLADFASLGPGARTGGKVIIGSRTMVGMQTAILQGIRIGSDSVVGAHSLINRDVENNTVSWGVPARPIRTRLRSDFYF